MPRLQAAEKEEMQVRGRKPGGDTLTRLTGLQMKSSFRGSWQVRKPVREAVLLLFQFFRVKRHRGPQFLRHLPSRVFKSISETETGKGLTAGRVTDILCEALTQKRGHSCSANGRNTFLIQCLKNQKAHSWNTEQSSKGSATVLGREFPIKRAVPVRKHLRECRWNWESPCSPEM